MNSEICDKLSVFCMGLFSVATASSAGAGMIALGGAGTLLAMPALWRGYRSWSDCPEKTAVSQASSAALTAYRESARRNHDLPATAVAPAEAALASVVDLIVIDPAGIAGAQWDMAALPGLIVDAAAMKSEEFAEPSPDPQAGHNRTLLAFVARQVLAALKVQPGFEASVMPAFRRDVVGQLAAIERNQHVHTALLKELLRRIPETEEGLRAEKTGVPEETIIALARKYSEDAEDIETAMAEIERAISVAIEVRTDAARGHNFGSELDEIFDRLARLTDEGRLSDAAAEADREVAQWEEMQSEMQARGIALLGAGIRQNILNRDATGAARKIAHKLELETPDGSNLFDALRAVQDEWYVRGRDKGLNFDLEVSIALAQLSRDRAATADQRGAALNDLGLALNALGERESGTLRLEAAVAAYRSALEECTRERVPFHWAATHNNLGNALSILGERESGTAWLEAAIAAYRSALEEWTRERVPLDWAMTQNNLGNALQTLGQRESGTARLEEAVAAYRSALEERTRARVPLDWAMTQNNLGAALRSLGQRESGTARLEAAVAAYRSALEERTRERVPLLWAQTRENMALAFKALSERTGEAGWRADAIEAVSVALEVYCEAGAEYNIEKAQRLLAQLQDETGN
ncbi:tetratricopeptide repeat protein [uncultured Hoeflea sp.]|uniref:tetratricopeptide repeat protein n=1 Tax=uncultured Hoeflea sp. TaxID=538666 RepID=UPI00260289DE|nr:tetratricopeptide repeat protein [uncultured Hoeflea sp.]